MFKHKINFQIIKKGFEKTIWFFGERAFISFIIFVSIALFIGGAIFYYYGFLVVSEEPTITTRAIELDQNLYQDFLDYYTQRKQKFFEADLKVYFNPFYQGQN